jgi:hypothetical protein
LAVWIPKTVTLTGVKWYQITAGVYTANNYNGVALYSHSSGTLTQVASSTNDGNIWKATSSTFASKAFSSTYSAAPGLYYIASIWCYSAYTTLPTVASGSLSTLGSQSNFAAFDFTNNKVISSLDKKVGIINGLEVDLQKLTDKELKAKTEEFRARYKEAGGNIEREMERGYIKR